MAVLDAGIGPGTTSKLIVETIAPGLLIGLDASTKQLKTAKLRLEAAGSLQLVRGSFEFLPFRAEVFDAIMTCFALRDSLDLSKSIEEYHRVCRPTGVLADVDLGKPDGVIKRLGSTFYIMYVMPLVAKAAIRGRLKGNPWRMMVPTYGPLPTNNVLLSRMKSVFGSVEFRSFLSGGVVVLIARKQPTGK
jgi:demethylmenaquinone methyltransferase/2-methoxy-6-polyprenyl-1,4-benzoquinol methylase